MRRRRLGLRGKSIVALGVACLVALIPTTMLGWLVLADMREHSGLAYARNLTLLNRARIVAPVSRTLELSKRMAESEVVRQWLDDENDALKRALFFQRAEEFRQDIHDQAWFVAVAASGHYYVRDSDQPAGAPPTTLSRDAAKDRWFFATMTDPAPFNIHADFNDLVGATKLWFNVVVQDGTRRTGVIGAALDLALVMRVFAASGESGVTPMIVNRAGALEFHPDKSLTAHYWAVDRSSVLDLLDGPTDRMAFEQALRHAESQPDGVAVARVSLGGKNQLMAIGYVPDLQWHVVTAVDIASADILDISWFHSAILIVVLLLVLLLAGFGLAVERLVLQPLRRLHASASAIAGGCYDVALPATADDELGELTAAFAVMADRVARHTEELEDKVRERTAALEDSNRKIAEVHKQIADSIDYARMIQCTILPDNELRIALGAEHHVLWQPRDVVGGDFCICHVDGDNCLVGVVDCAGHGVPGALMAMAGRAAITRAIHEAGSTSPAAVLARTDAIIRTMLSSNHLAIATNMDAGLIYIDRGAGLLRFAGARMGMFWTDGVQVEEIKGGHRALGERRHAECFDYELPRVPGRTYHLATDGFFDQAGGDHGFGFGKRRFAAMVREHAALPLSQQAAAFAATLERYQRGCPQRDDITMLSFRFT